ncbi:hypothetical protein ABPG74_016215 [Tetrahymena malaccensis]
MKQFIQITKEGYNAYNISVGINQTYLYLLVDGSVYASFNPTVLEFNFCIYKIKGKLDSVLYNLALNKFALQITRKLNNSIQKSTLTLSLVSGYVNQNRLTYIYLALKSANSQQCPQLQTFHNPMVSKNYLPKNVIRIPKTNILIINTLYDYYEDSSIVYYNDISSKSGEIINVIKPDYVIIDMKYNDQTDQLVVSNYNTIIFADPYTLKALASFSIPNLQSIMLLDQTNYILLTIKYNQIQIFDFLQQKILLNMDNTKQLTAISGNTKLFQYKSALYQLSTGDKIIITSNDAGLISWGIDLQSLTYQFYGYIPNSQKNLGDISRSFIKHPLDDVIFIGGNSTQIIALKIVDIKKNNYQLLYNTSLMTINSAITNFIFVNLSLNKYQLWAGDGVNIYQIKFKGSSYTINKYYYYQADTYYDWYQVQESQSIIICSKLYLTIFNYTSYQQSYSLYFYGDLYSRRFIWQNDGYNDTLALLSGNTLNLYDKGNFGYTSQYSNKPQLQKSVRFKYGSFYTIKKQNSTCFYKGTNDGTDSGNSYIGIFPIFPFSQGDTIIDITTLYKLQWVNINQNLDPFFLNNNIWVAFAFPAKSQTENYLFQLINCNSTNQRVYLKSNLTTDNQVKTAFAIASLENKNNLELIGVDNQGTVYSWDLSQQGFPFNFYINFSFCKNPIMGDIFHYDIQKRLIISCDDSQVYSFDYKNGSYQNLTKLSSQPLALKAFADPKVVVIGDPNNGIAFIYKFDISSNQFILLLQLQSSKIQDQLIYIEMLKDYTIWVQYTYSNLFYSLAQCLDNPQQCTQCTQQYSFKATNSYDYYGYYGQGIPGNPYTSSANFLTAMIKAQYYKQIIVGVSNIGVDVLIEPGSILDLNKNFMNFDFNSIISLNFKSTIRGNKASLLNFNVLELQNYNYIGFQDIIIYFGQDSSQTECGISVTNIKQGVNFDNIQLYQQFQTSDIKSCQKIKAESAQIRIQKYEIRDENFSNHQYIISSFNSNQISIQNMIISDCKFGFNFSILRQFSNLNAYIENLQISGNVCPEEQQDTQTVSQLFQAGYFSVKNANITNNIFCKKVIFSVVSSQNQEFQQFLFQNIDIRNNQFQARTQYLLFSALYSMIAVPQHQLNLNNINFYNNTLFQRTLDDFKSAQYFQTNKIAVLQIQQITIQNHYDIQLAFIEQGKSISIKSFSCFNDQTFLEQIPNQLAVGCLEMNEIQQVDIYDLQVVYKKVQDSSIIIIKNKLTQQAKFQMIQGNFTNIFLNQTGVNTESIPIYVISDYSIEINLDSCLFQNINLNSVPFTITFSSAALFVQNYVGSVLIKNSQFFNSYSNSIYGFIFIQANTFILDTVQFSNSTFPIDKSLSMFNTEGGMINVKAEVINITNSNFSKSTSSYGAFIYFESFSQILNINLMSSSFSEGYALNDGSAFFIDTQGQQLNFNSQNCQYKNLFIFQSQASTIGIEKYLQAKNGNHSLISIQGGQIINAFGDIDNYFIDVINTKIQFSGKLGILSEDFSSNSLAHLFFKAQNNNKYQFATLINIQNSNLTVQDCQFKNIYITSNLSTFPLILSSTNSSVNIQNTQIFDSSFVSSALSLVQSNVSLSQVTFTNVNQKILKRRIIQEAQRQQVFKNINQIESNSRNIEQENQFFIPNIQSASLIISQQSRLNINQNSNFHMINCDQCNGGAIQAIQSTINIQNAVFKEIQSAFGGAVFIYGINNTNYIQNTQFISCQAQVDGGGMYLVAQQNDKFKLEITESLFENNSCVQRGGGIYFDSETLNSPNQQIKLQNCQVIRNRAAIGGGIFLQNISTDVQQQNVISSNSASIYGSDQSSYPTQLRISNIDEFLSQNDGIVNKEQIEIHRFRSGANLTRIELQLLNQKDEIVLPTAPEEEDLFEISVQFDSKTQNPQSYIATGQISTKYDKNLKSFTFSYINLVGLPETQYGQQLKSSKENQLPEQQSSKIPKYSQKQNINLNEEEQIKNLWLDQDNMIFIPTIQIDTIQNFNNCNTEMAIQNEQKEAATSRLKEQQSNQYLIQFQSSDSISNQVCSNNQNQNNTNTSIQLTKQGQQNKKNLSQYQKKHKNIKIQSNNPTAYVQNYQDLGLNQKQEINIYSLDALDNLDTQNNFYDPANSQQEDQNEEKMTNQQQQQLNIVSDTEQLQQESANKYQKINDNINVQEDLVNQKVTINNLVNELVYSKITRLKDQITQSNSEVIQFKDEDSIGNEDQYDTYVENNMNQLENKTKTNYQNNDNCDAEVQRQQKQVLDHVVNNNLIQFSQNDIENQFEYSSVQSEKNGDSKEIQVEEN